MCIRDRVEGKHQKKWSDKSEKKYRPFSIAERPNGCQSYISCLLYTSDAADERSSVDLGGRRIIKKKKSENKTGLAIIEYKDIQDVHQ